MAAPTQVTLADLSGQWTLNTGLSDSYDEILKAQKVNWVTRRVLTMWATKLSISQGFDAETGLSTLDIENKAGDLPSTHEHRIIGGDATELRHPLFGNVRGSTKWASRSELPSEWAAAGLEDLNEDKFILMRTDHLDIGLTTYQTNGFEHIKDEKRYVRHVEVHGTDGEAIQKRLVYDFLGPVP